MASSYQQQWSHASNGTRANHSIALGPEDDNEEAVVEEPRFQSRWQQFGLIGLVATIAVFVLLAITHIPPQTQITQLAPDNKASAAVTAVLDAIPVDSTSLHEKRTSHPDRWSSHSRHHFKSERSREDDEDEDEVATKRKKKSRKVDEDEPTVKETKPVASSPAVSTTRPKSDAPSEESESEKPDAPNTDGDVSIINSNKDCAGPFPGYPYCQDKVDELRHSWASDANQEAYYRSQGVDGTQCSFLTYLNLHGFYCPEAADTGKAKIRGVNLGGWLVLEPWIVPSLFEQFPPHLMIQDQWTFCEHLGPTECRRQLTKHWDTWVTEDDISFLAAHGINHLRIPFGYWIFGDIRAGEPWVTGELPFIERVIQWAKKYDMHVILDMHCAPGSQNGFDNSCRKGEIHFGDSVKERYGRTEYPNIRRALEVIANVTSHFSQPQFSHTVVGIELVNEAFVTIPIQVVKDYYLQGYEIVKQNGDTMAVIIGDSFRFGAWNDFMFPPHYRHVWIDTHIYQVFDASRLQMTWAQHISQTCHLNKPEVAVAPLSTMVGEFSLATTDCAKWLNGYGSGSRFDGTFPGGQTPKGSCIGQDDLTNTTIWTPEYKGSDTTQREMVDDSGEIVNELVWILKLDVLLAWLVVVSFSFLLQYASKQMDAYESGSSEGWFFWNFKTEKGAFQWNYILGVKEGWIPGDLDHRPYKCD